MTDPYGYYDFSDEPESVEPAPAASGDPAEVLRRYWGYPAFRPMQEEIVRSLLAGNDTIGLLPTGGGKSITFQVPALMSPGLTLVITPLVSLMKDQVDNLRKRHIGAAYLHSGMSRHESQYAFERCAQGRVKMLYVAPERAASDNFLMRVTGWNVSNIVVDEAHCISQWGYDFRPSYMRLTLLREKFPHAPVLALTASATPKVTAEIARRLEMRSPRLFSLSFTRDNISFLVRHTEDKYGKLVDILRATQGSTIVYTRSRRKAADIAAMLCRDGFEALFYHAGLESHDKAERQDAWHSGKARIMVATTAFGMGIDKPDVRLVVHYDLPTTLEEYYQEAGRAGRDGEPSVAVILASKRDKSTLTRRIAAAFPEKDYIRKVYDEICRYLSLPMGEGFGAIFDFRGADFCTRYHMEPRAVAGAIGVLARSGYFDFIEELDIESRVMILMRRDDLYRLDTDEATDGVLNFMLRNYEGLFSDAVFINEDYIAQECGMNRLRVIDILKALRHEHVISYSPRRTTAQLYFTCNRVPGEKLTFPHEVYDDRRTAMEQQIKAMTDFVYDDTHCRVAAMLRYFGETDAPDCGKCDICRARKNPPKPFDPAEFERRLPAFFAMIAPQTWLDVYSLRPYYPHTYPRLVAHIDAMAAAGRLRINGSFIAMPE